MDRDRQIVRTSLFGIGVNLVLVAFKAGVGVVTNSIAVVLDAVNNLGDALSSAVTIVGTRLAAKRPDRKHPYGYGRIEYITSVVVAAIVLSAGIAALRESAAKAWNPPETSYSWVSLAILAAGVAVKLLAGRHVRAVGRRIGSGALEASGADAFFDAVLSFGTLLAAGASMLWGLRLEGWLGVGISLFIVRAGVGMLLETLDSIIGLRPDGGLVARVKEILLADPKVRGVFDLSLHNYGPSRIVGSVHVEVPDGTGAREIHALTRGLAIRVFRELGVILTIGIYAGCEATPALAAIRNCLEAMVAARPEILEVHGFLGDEAEKTVLFDLVVDFEADALGLRNEILAELAREFPEWHFDAVLDADTAG